MMFWPKCCSISLATMRALMVTVPAAVNGTARRMGRCGNDCPQALPLRFVMTEIDQTVIQRNMKLGKNKWF